MNLCGHVIDSPKMPIKKFPDFRPTKQTRIVAKKSPKKVLRSLFVWQGRNSCNFWFVFWEKRWSHKFILNLTDL